MKSFWLIVMLTFYLSLCQVKSNDDCWPVTQADLDADNPEKDNTRVTIATKYTDGISTNPYSNNGVTVRGRTKNWVTVDAGDDTDYVADMNYFAVNTGTMKYHAKSRYYYLKKNGRCALNYDYNDINSVDIFKVKKRA